MPVKIAGLEESCGLLTKTGSQTRRSEDTTGVRRYQTDASKMVWACVTDEGQQTDQKCTLVEVNREKTKRTTKQKIDGLY